jgi:ABC-type Fe3+-hydroxamate transport system substrate-binding protein
MRVVSLVPSVTETLLAWGLAPVAVTRFCEHPELPAVGGTKDPDVAAIAGLAPDLVVMNEEENRREDADALSREGLAVHVVRVRAVADVPAALEALAAAVGVDAPGAGLASDEPPTAARAFVPIWRRPWMTLNGDTYGSSLLRALGVENLFAAAADRYPEITLDDAAALAPDVVLAPSEPYPFGARHVAELAQVAPVELVDGKDLFWWGVRTAGARERLAQRLAIGSSRRWGAPDESA